MTDSRPKRLVGPKTLTAIRSARAEIWPRAWEPAGANGPATYGHVTVDIDGVLVVAHSEKQDATATWEEPSAVIPWPRSSTTGGTAPENR